MNSEELLKSISSILKKHKDFLNDNPEIFYTIEDRLYKAVDDEYDDEEDAENYVKCHHEQVHRDSKPAFSSPAERRGQVRRCVPCVVAAPGTRAG